jgi:hypothetical protein
MVLTVVAATLAGLAAPVAPGALVAKVDVSPAWSPDGTRIAFVRALVDTDARGGPVSPSQVLCTVRPDGSGEAVVTGEPARASWSPRRGQNVLIFALWRSAFLLDADTLDRRELLRCMAGEPVRGAFLDAVELSLDGKEALVVERGPTPGTRYVRILDAETGQPLMAEPPAFPASGECGQPPRFPLRSSTGWTLTRVGDTIEVRTPGSSNGVPLFLATGMYGATTAWSPDGASITLTMPTGAAWAAQVDNGAIWQASAGPATPPDEAPPVSAGSALSPDGATKAFFYANGLWSYTVASRKRVLLAQFARARYGYATVAWSPDGKRLAYSWSGRIGTSSLSGGTRFITGPPWEVQ